jgi:hypothetical protein
VMIFSGSRPWSRLPIWTSPYSSPTIGKYVRIAVWVFSMS